MSALQQRWDLLAPRERRALVLGALVLVIVLLWLLLWDPLSQSREQWRARVIAAESDLAWMRSAAPLVQARSAGAPRALQMDGRSLLARVDSSAKEAGLGNALLRIEPVAAGQVRLHFEQAGFDSLMRWLEALSSQYGTQVSELSVQRADGVGVVDARVGLIESGAP